MSEWTTSRVPPTAIETSVCKRAWFEDPDGDSLMLHRRYDV